jgi:O-antigen chain-terminating methyltransferase
LPKTCWLDGGRPSHLIEGYESKALPIVQGDALGYLRGLPDACLGAVTSFHMAEHLPFDVVLTLVDESLRVLKSGGILILETPNPANLLVGAHTFHLDPMHLKPLPSPMLRFFVEGRGFCDVHVRELHPYPEVVRLHDDGSGVAGRLNDCLYGPQDYAVIGRKP